MLMTNKLTLPVESRMQGDLHVRFGGRLWETYHRKVVRRPSPSLQINDEQEDFTRPWLENSVYADKIKFYIGNALEMVPQFDLTFDLAFIDGDKRRYIDYYEMVLPRLSDGGYILADNTLWDGHVLEEQPHRTDLQTIGIKAFNDLIAQDSRVEKVILPLRDGLTIIRKK